MHTDHTLAKLDATTIRLGKEFRHFTKTTCASFETRELKRELEARQRRKLKKTSKISGPLVPDTHGSEEILGRKFKRFHLRFIKYHYLGDHGDQIREFGTTDSFSTEPVIKDLMFIIALSI